MNEACFQAPSTGHDEFDKQHRDLISILDRLAATQNAYEANRLTLALIALWQEHHLSEERWMRSVKFAFEDGHKLEHKKLGVFFANLSHLANSLPFLDELPKHTEVIFAKLKEHIATYDVQFRPYLRS